MDNGVKMRGRSVEEAIDSALQVLGITRDEASIKVLNEGKSGVLGMFGGEEAEVEVSRKTGMLEEAKITLQAIMDKAGFLTTIEATKEEQGRIYLEIKGDDLGRIIGREGAALDALQILVSSILSKKAQGRVPVTIDAASYRERRGEKIKELALEALEEALAKNEELTLPPMSAADRREAHIAIKEDGRGSSFSVGEGSERRLVVSPAKEEEGGKKSS